ncbi:MAG TPA: tail fiber domain-containing protein, partial [Candidatus Deferrimicrobium sp.]|nr:tail fiber domain-containing protein [Candidatus Deferrimicrobium sp.]
TVEALEALNQLNPVRYNYKVDKTDECLGFIAEDVPNLVATADRKSLSPMDITAVLTKVVQELRKENEEYRQENEECRKLITDLQERMAKIEKVK